MVDLGTIIPSAGLGGAGLWAGQAIGGWWKTRQSRADKKVDADVALEKHRDNLTFELLRAAREEVAAARIEAAEIRTIQLRLLHFEEAMDHIEALLNATDAEAKAAADRRASQFLVRMKRFSAAQGALRNEAAIAVANERQNIVDNKEADNGKPTP